MTEPHRIYRFSIWLPVIVPVVVIVVMNVLLKGFGMPKPSGFLDAWLDTIAGSVIVAGIPYVALAIWATAWVGDKPEIAIRRLMFVAPLLMVAVWFAWCLVMAGIRAAFGGTMEGWSNVAIFGAGPIVVLGYGYVGLTIVLRWMLGPRAREAEA